MKLILERHNGLFAYYEDEEHFAKVEPGRGTRRIPTGELDLDCDLDRYLLEGEHMVFEVKKKSKKG